MLFASFELHSALSCSTTTRAKQRRSERLPLAIRLQNLRAWNDSLPRYKHKILLFFIVFVFLLYGISRNPIENEPSEDNKMKEESSSSSS